MEPEILGLVVYKRIFKAFVQSGMGAEEALHTTQTMYKMNVRNHDMLVHGEQFPVNVTFSLGWIEALPTMPIVAARQRVIDLGKWVASVKEKYSETVKVLKIEELAHIIMKSPEYKCTVYLEEHIAREWRARK